MSTPAIVAILIVDVILLVVFGRMLADSETRIRVASVVGIVLVIFSLACLLAPSLLQT